MFGPEGLIKVCEEVWTRSDRQIQSEDYHTDIDTECFFKWFDNPLNHAPLNSVILLDNAAVHSKRAQGTPKSTTYMEDMQQLLIDQGIEFSSKALKTEL